MEILRLIPTIKNYLWAGKKMVKRYNYKPLPGTKTIAEAWSLSLHQAGLSMYGTPEKPFEVCGLLADNCPRSAWGSACKDFEEFPILIKLIDSGANLSVQVHPDDDYALANEGQYGKTEFWYVIDADEGAGVYIGFKDQIDKNEYATRIANGTLTEVLQFFPVKKGSYYMIPAGTVHAIGKGILLAEIQQSSNVTYRVYDYNRVDKNGKKRELQVQKAMDVSELMPYIRPCFRDDILADSKHFTTELKSGEIDWYKLKSFTAITFVYGMGAIVYVKKNGEDQGLLANEGDTFFIPAGVRVQVKLFDSQALFTYVSESAIG